MLAPVEIRRSPCLRKKNFTLQFAQVTQAEWSDRILKGVKIRSSCGDEKLKDWLRRQAKAGRKAIASLQRHPDSGVAALKELTWLDYRYGTCKCDRPFEIPGVEHCLCPICKWVGRSSARTF